MAEEEEVRSEVEAVQAVYGEYCHVISDYPPHLTVHVSPRTAEDSSQQFVEVTLGLKADVEYPKKPPYVYILEMKGLDEDRQEIMITKLNNKARELSCCLMLVALCEEAVESLSAMNHPDGDCPLCLYPLVAEDKSGLALPFMKLMSCYHCFHSECIIRFWKWLQEQNVIIGANQADKGTQINVNCRKANCPACRKEFDIKDMEHVLNYLGTSSFQLSSSGTEMEEEAKDLLQSVSENRRRENFESILRKQQEDSGLNEPKKNLAILPGMFLPANITKQSTSSETSNEQRDDDVRAEPIKSSEKSSKVANISKQRNPRSKPGQYNSKRPMNSNFIPASVLGSSKEQNSSGTETEEAKDLLQSISENKRRENFESMLKKQHENSGLNEPKKNQAISLGMYLPANIKKQSTSSETSNERRDNDVHAEPIKSSENSSKEANINKQRNPRSKPGQYNSKRPMNSNFIPASVLGSSKENSSGTEMEEEAKDLLQSISENKRRENFESILKKQQENSGLNEPKKNLAILPGMYLPANIKKQSTSSETSNEQRDDDVRAEPIRSSENSSKEANINKQRNPRSKPGHYNSKRPMNSQPNRKQWVRKDL